MSVLNSTIDVQVFPDSQEATQFAADWLVGQLTLPATRNVMLAGGNTPLALYAAVAEHGANLSHLTLFALDEYVGVPLDEPRNCANLIRDRAVKPWRIPEHRCHSLSSLPAEAEASILAHEEKIGQAGGIDLVVLGLGKNGHIGFNEPGSEPSASGRVVPLSKMSIEANKKWFDGAYAPEAGVTAGMGIILSARKILLLAFVAAKAPAIAAMLGQTPGASCPASFLQTRPDVLVVLDEQAAGGLQLS